MKPLHLFVHMPQSEEGRRELAKKVAEIHAQSTVEIISGLRATTEQRIALAERILANEKAPR